MSNKYMYRYDFDNFEDPYRFKLKLKNGCGFKFLNNYYKYHFYPKENEQLLFCYCFLEKENKYEAEKRISFSNNVLQYICTVPISNRDIGVSKINSNKVINFEYVNISDKKIKKLRYISDKILRFKVERKLFEEVISLNGAALLNLTKYNMEDSILYYFKIIEKLSKKNYIKFHERNYTKLIKRSNKEKVYDFIKEYFHKNLRVDMTENMLNTTTDEIYKKLRNEAYNSTFLKISFFCNCKNISVNLDELCNLVKVRNRLAHGDSVDQSDLDDLIKIAIKLSNEFISLYFFQKKYSDINIDTDIFE